MRECLKKTGMEKTLAAYDAERPKSSTEIKSRAAITRGLHIEKLVKRHQQTKPGVQLPSLLELLTDYLANRAPSKSPKTEDMLKITTASKASSSFSSAHQEDGFGAKRTGGLGGRPGGARHSRGQPRGGSIFDDASPKKPAHQPEPQPEVKKPLQAKRPPNAAGSGDGMRMDEVEGFDANVGEPVKPFKFSADDDDFGFGAVEPARFGGAGGAAGGVMKGVPLSYEEGRECRAMVLGKADYQDSWRQGFYWTQEPSLRYGLWQEQGGPCGVLAAVQSYVLVQLIYRMPADGNVLAPTDTRRDAALVNALAHILWMAGQGRRAVVLMRKGSDGSLRKDRFEQNLMKYEFTSEPEVCPRTYRMAYLPIGAVLGPAG
jgi:hypothetical protein